MANLDRTGWTAYASSNYSGEYVPAMALDGSSGTFWHSANGSQHSFWVDMGAAETFNYLTWLPRNFTNQEPRDVTVYVSADGVDWGDPVISVQWMATVSTKTVVFPAQTARWCKCVLTAYSGFATCAELNAGYDLAAVGDLSAIELTTDEATVGDPYSFDGVEVSQGVAPYTVSVISGALPTGLTIDNDGVISGTPTGTGGSFTATVRATDSAAATRDVSVSMYVFKPGSPDPGATIAGMRLIVWMAYQWSSYAGHAYIFLGDVAHSPGSIMSGAGQLYLSSAEFAKQALEFELPVNGTGAVPVTGGDADASAAIVWLSVGGPNGYPLGWGLNEFVAYGLYFQADYSDGARLYSHPSTVSVVQHTGTVEDADAAIDEDLDTYAKISRDFFSGLGLATYLRITGFGEFGAIPPTIGCNNPLDGTVGVEYSHTLTTTNAATGSTFSIVGGTLPPGLTLNAETGVISGTPTALGSYDYDVRVTTPGDETAEVACNITIIGVPSRWLDLWVWRQLFSLESLDQDMAFPSGYARALKLELAARFGRAYPGHDLKRIQQQLSAAIESIDRENVTNSQAVEDLPAPENSNES